MGGQPTFAAHRTSEGDAQAADVTVGLSVSHPVIVAGPNRTFAERLSSAVKLTHFRHSYRLRTRPKAAF